MSRQLAARRPTAIALAVASVFPALALRAADDGGAPAGSEFTVTASGGLPYGRGIACAGDGRFVVAFGTSAGPRVQRYDANGIAQGPPVVVSTAGSFVESVAMDDAGDFVVTYARGYDVFAARFDATGLAQGGELAVNTTTVGRQFHSDVAMNGSGEFVVVWSGPDFGQHRDEVDSGIYARTYAADGTPRTGEFRANAVTTNGQYEPRVAIDADGDFVVVWADYGAFNGVRGRRFDAQGQPLGGDFDVDQAGGGRLPDVAMSPDGGFVVGWQGSDPDYSDTVRARLFGAAGAPLTPDLQVNSQTSDNQLYPAVAMSASGDFVVAWNVTSFGGLGYGPAQARRYSRIGEPVGPEFDVSQAATPQVRNASVAMRAAGDFVVAWGGYSFVAARRFTWPDIVPAAFAFPDRLGVATGTLFTSSPVTLSGLGPAGAPLRLDARAPTAQYAINGGSFRTGPATVSSGDTLQLRVKSPDAAHAQFRLTLDVGDGVDIWRVATGAADTTPERFSFPNQTVPPSTYAVSAPVTVSGINTAVPIAIQNTPRARFSINGGPWLQSGSAQPGDSVRLRLQASPDPGVQRRGHLVIGGIGTFWVVTAQP